MAHRLTALLMLSLLLPAPLLPQAAAARQHVAPTEAEALCLNRARRYARERVGPSSRERTDFEVRANYVRCIHGYTGQSPRVIPPLRD